MFGGNALGRRSPEREIRHTGCPLLAESGYSIQHFRSLLTGRFGGEQ